MLSNTKITVNELLRWNSLTDSEYEQVKAKVAKLSASEQRKFEGILRLQYSESCETAKELLEKATAFGLLK